MKLNKLELTWIGKDDERPAIEPRILIEDPTLDYGEVETGTLPNGKPWPGNMLIHGEQPARTPRPRRKLHGRSQMYIH